LRLGRAAEAHLVELISRAEPVHGEFFRSVAFRHFHPDDVVSGEGTRLHGGRFVPPGIAAVFASLDEQTALREATARKSLLHGRNLVEFRDYPRMMYVLRITTQRNLDLSIPLVPDLQNVIERALRPGKHTASQGLAKIWIEAGIESVVFPSATGFGRNVVVYLPNSGAGSVIVHNRAAVLAALRRPNQ
jgi:RES domain-containing protein